MSTETDQKKRDGEPEVDYETEMQRKHLRRAVGIPLALTLPVFQLLGATSIPARIIGIVMTAIGGALLGPDLAEAFGRAFANVLWSDRSGGKKPAYGTPMSRMVAHQFAEAREEYEKVIAEFPGEVKPHIELIKMAFLKLKDEALAKQFHERAMQSLESPDARNQVTSVYEMLGREFKVPKREKKTLALHPPAAR